MLKADNKSVEWNSLPHRNW